VEGNVTAGTERQWTTKLAEDKPAVTDIEFAEPGAANAAAQRLGGRLRASAFIESVGGEADRVELIPSAATDAEAEQLSRRLVEVMRRNGFHLTDQTRAGRLAMW